MIPIWKKEWERVLRETRESKKLDDEFLKIIVKRIREGLTTYQQELNSLPEKYKKNLIYYMKILKK